MCNPTCYTFLTRSHFKPSNYLINILTVIYITKTIQVLFALQFKNMYGTIYFTYEIDDAAILCYKNILNFVNKKKYKYRIYENSKYKNKIKNQNVFRHIIE